jgi:hypothetical protein
LFQIVPAAGSFGKDYGPDLAVWLAPRRVDPFRVNPRQFSATKSKHLTLQSGPV